VVTPEEHTLAAAFLAECWPVCRELPRDVRAGDAAVAAIRNADLENRVRECGEVVHRGAA
jgi:hypothetical protein